MSLPEEGNVEVDNHLSSPLLQEKRGSKGGRLRVG